VAALALLLLWAAVYWLWPSQGLFRAGPSSSAIRFDARPPLTAAEPLASAAPRTAEPSAAAHDAAAARSAATPVPPAQQPSAVQPPRFTERVVQAGQTMQSLAEEVYGDASLWEAIAKANPFVDPAALSPGQRLRIPLDPTNIQGKAVAPTVVQPPAPRFPMEYVVEQGDTLSAIAKRLYGRSSLHRIIFEANRAQLTSPDAIKPGMRLLIPEPPRP